MERINASDFTVLIVDDLSKNIQILGSVLREHGYEVDYATNGKKALELIELIDFDLILLDIMMPNMDGFEVCSRIRQQTRFDDIPVIFITAKADKTSIIKGFEVGGQDYITKPFDANELVARVRTHIELKDSKQKLKRVNDELEDRVRARTSELEKANQKLKKLDESKSQFLSIISHEIRTPLYGILGGAELMKESDLPEETKFYLELLLESSERLEVFASKAIDISNLNLLGEKLLKMDRVDLCTVFNDVLVSNKALVESKNITVDMNCQTQIITTDVDPVFMKKSFQYIYENALNYASEASTVYLSIVKNEEWISIKIMNEGSQFSPDYDINETQPFYIGNHVDQNTGLSLYLCKLIIDAHNGTISNGNNENCAFVEIRLKSKSLN